MLLRGTFLGICSGFVLGLMMKWFESLSSVKVYTLFLNVDFIPLLGDYIWPEWIEFFFHQIIAVIIGLLYVFILEKYLSNRIKSKFILAFILTFPTVFLYFPLAVLAIKDVPDPANIQAFGLWAAAHFIYFLSLPFFYWIADHKNN
ncbi:hypothetical protein [Jeotgalibacillus proteolyticus]|uniref:DUF1440 domain-containing protein n=1 Tax=Jeotgalibacillus proteolyticus TaxID=2082395 RepID=A0A2S5GGZ7_9BACL|nr:hypothetical protein [Jeotgalibacillus proteolyticus]PPA72181.1 hypothetical protein C4B60_02045 [Jeotgalibacillus proteolyticus]